MEPADLTLAGLRAFQNDAAVQSELAAARSRRSRLWRTVRSCDNPPMMVHSRVRIAFVSLVLAFGAACSSSDDDGGGDTPALGGNGAEPAALNGITAAHNALRASVDPPAAAAIPPLAWSAEIADVAQAHARTCKLEHDLNSGYGENLHANTADNKKSTPDQVVKSWGSEAANYDYDANDCSDGKTCGHYTQVVWAASLRLGCGVALCTENSPFDSSKSWELWVCNYDPPGNFGDARPY